MIRLVVGLGNPGQQYQQTRHNAGFVFLDNLVSVVGGKWTPAGQFQGETATCVVGGSKLLLLKPMTFMNKSGVSVGSFLRYYRFKSDEMLVVHDELELPAGALRLKRDGGHSGHNGLRDIIAHIDSKDFYRLRMGIGRPAAGVNVADYVLSKPLGDESSVINDVSCLMIKHMDLLLRGDIEAVNKLTVFQK